MTGRALAMRSFGPILIATLALVAPSQTSAQDAKAKHLTLLGIPSATVAPANLAFASIAATTNRAGGANGLDGSLALGFGLGSAEDGVGLQFTTHVTSLSETFGDSGYLELKASRLISRGARPTYIALALGNLGTWGDARVRDTSATIALSTFSTLRFSPAGDSFPVMFTIGAGSHLRNGQTDPGVFAGLGIGLTPNFGASVAWNGEYVNLGTSFRIDGLDGVTLTAGLYDAFDQKNSQRLAVAVTFATSNLFTGRKR